MKFILSDPTPALVPQNLHFSEIPGDLCARESWRSNDLEHIIVVLLFKSSETIMVCENFQNSMYVAATVWFTSLPSFYLHLEYPQAPDLRRLQEAKNKYS